MLYFLLDWINDKFDLPGFGVFQYITFRSVLAITFSLVISLLIGKHVIDFLRRKSFGESIRDEGPASHKKKAGTPTMGGLLIIAAIIIPSLLWCDLTNIYVILMIISTLWIGTIGFIDDYIKVFKKDKGGLSGRFKIVGQVGLGLIVGITMVTHPDFMGKKGKIYQGHTVRPDAMLEEVGFQFGDYLVAVNGEEYKGKAFETHQLDNLSLYTIERGKQPGKRQLINIEVPKEKVAEVANSLFNDQDITFMTSTNIPFLKRYSVDYSLIAFWEAEGGLFGKIIYVMVVIFIVTAVSNAVNLTDGLDGLAAGTSAITIGALMVLSYVSGNIIFADYLNISYIPMSAELVIFCASMVGACVGFLWYNTHPAQVFMGDTGSLALGGAIAVLALMIKKELLIPIMCGIFFLESLSVMAQVAYFKYTKKKYGEGKRIFRMAPIHHHFELGGMKETKIVVRFWIVAVFLAILAFATLKLR